MTGSALVLLALLDSCTKTSTSPTAPAPTSTTTLVGTFADAVTSGTVALTVASSLHALSSTSPSASTGATAATGTLTKVDGATTALNGTFDFGTGKLAVSGGSDMLTGTEVNNVLDGTFSGANGLGAFASLPPSSTGGAPKVYCGTYTSNDSGWFNVVIASSGVLSGVTHPTTAPGSSVTLSGTLSGSALNITGSQNVAAHGTLSADGVSLSGTLISPLGAPGSFQGSTAACGATSSGSSIAGSWADTAGGQVHLQATLLETGTAVRGVTILTVPPCPGTGGSFTITSGRFASGAVTFTGAADSGTAIVGFTGTRDSATTMTGTLTHSVCGGTLLVAGFTLTKQ